MKIRGGESADNIPRRCELVADVGTCTDTHTCTRMWVHVQTPAPAGTHSPILQGAWGQEPPLAVSPGVGQGVSPSWPRPGLRIPTAPAPHPPGLEREVHPRELHQGPGREAGRDGKDRAPLGTKVLDLHPALAKKEDGQREETSCPVAFLGPSNAWATEWVIGWPFLLLALPSWSLQRPWEP